MSKFIDKLNSVWSGGLAPMGFRAVGGKPKPKMIVVAHVVGVGTKPTVAGADAVLLSIPKAGAKSPQTLAKATPDIPWGGRLDEVTGPAIKKLGEGGAELAVFRAASAA